MIINDKILEFFHGKAPRDKYASQGNYVGRYGGTCY